MDQDLPEHVQAETISESNSLEQEGPELDTKIDVVCEEGASDNGQMEQFEVINDVSKSDNEVKSIFKVMFEYLVKPANFLLEL